MNIILYLEAIKQKYKQGNATEHSYRPVFEQFLKAFIVVALVEEFSKYVVLKFD